MPTKFVTRAAERAGVSIETAEHRWKEAKSKIHKGKRRGSWYWGKVMNTFKRMMGLMENVTLQEWLLFESESPFASWPEQFHLYDRYVAVKVVDDELYVSYDVEALMGESTKIQLSGGTSRYAANPDEVSYTLGYDRDFTQQLGIRSDAKFANFKEWAVDAVQKFIAREGLAEMSEGIDPLNPLADLPDDIVLQKGYYLECYERSERNVRYKIKRLMDEEDKATDYSVSVIGGREEAVWTIRHANVAKFHRSIHLPIQQVNDLTDVKPWLWDTLSQEVGLKEARATSRKDTFVEPEWVPFSVEPISGQWPASRNVLWVALDDAFGNERDWNVKDKNKEHADKWKNNQPVTYVHHEDAKLDYKKLKAAGFKVTFLPD
jgi:hypothetical protein